MEENRKNIFTYSDKGLSLDNIVRIEELDDGTYIFNKDGLKSKSVLTIDELEWELPKDIFIRVHPKHLINKSFSKNIHSVKSLFIKLKNGDEIPVSEELSQQENNFFKQSINAFKRIKDSIIGN